MKFQDKTIGGFEYVIYTTHGKDELFPIVGEILQGQGNWNLIRWSADGERMPTTRAHEFDLVPIHEFKVDDKVLVRNYEDEPWKIISWPGYDQQNDIMLASGRDQGKNISWRYCIPYDPSIPNVA